MASDSQIAATTTGQYDQIFALSQSYLNLCFAAMFEKNVELQALDVKNIMGEMSATLGVPQIAVNINSDKYLTFYVNITKGSMKLRDAETGSVEVASIVVRR